MFELLMVGSATLWSLTYLLIIRQGFQDGTFGMPLIALCVNVAWEFIFSLVHPHAMPQRLANLIWLALDLGILHQLLRFGRAEFRSLTRLQFYGMCLAALATSLGLLLVLIGEFGDQIGVYTAFGQNLIMSILFVAMLIERNDLRGQSIYIALCKLLGTALASLAFYRFAATARVTPVAALAPILQSSLLLPILYVAVLVFDVIYVVMVYRKSAQARPTGAEARASQPGRSHPAL